MREDACNHGGVTWPGNQIAFGVVVVVVVVVVTAVAVAAVAVAVPVPVPVGVVLPVVVVVLPVVVVVAGGGGGGGDLQYKGNISFLEFNRVCVGPKSLLPADVNKTQVNTTD